MQSNSSRTIRVGRMLMSIRCEKFNAWKKSCDIECNFTCQLNSNGGSNKVLPLWDAVKEFHVTSYQLRCAVHDCIIHAEISQRGSRQAIFLTKDEVAEKLDTIRAYPRKSPEEVEKYNHYRLKLEKINISTENLSDDMCTLAKASLEFGITPHKLNTALEHGIIHIRQKKGDRCFVSKSEIAKNLEFIKKGDRIFFRLLNMKKPPSQERPQIHQLINEPLPVDSNLCGKCQGVTA